MSTFYKKTILSIALFSIIFSVGVFFFPSKSEALGPEGALAVPVGEIYSIPMEIKEGPYGSGLGLDTVGWMLAKMALVALTNSTVNWINSGFEGNPTFVENPGDFLADIADQTTGIFIQELGMTELCSIDWLPKLKLSLQYSVPYVERMQCTLTGVGENFEENLERFENSFLDGGWDTWLSMTMEPRNNIWGAYFESADELARRQAAAVESGKMEVSWGSGFVSLKKCKGASQETYCDKTCAHLEWSEEFDDCFNGCQDIEGVDFSSSDYCEQSGGTMKNTTPGRVIADELTGALGITRESLQIADEISESLTAIFNALISQLISTGLSSLSGEGGESGEWYDTPPSSDEITSATETIDYYLDYEYQYKDAKQASVDAYDTTISKLGLLKECYQKQNPPNQTKISEIQTQINSYETKKVPLQLEVDNSYGLINEAEELKTEISNADTYDELEDALNEFTTEVQPKMHLYDIQTAKTENDAIESELNAKNSAIDAEYNLCLSL